MKILRVTVNARKHCFEVAVSRRAFAFPFAKCDPAPSASDPVETAAPDPELGNEGFSYVLKSGREGSVHLDQILDYHKDPSYLRDLVVYQLTIEAQKRIAATPLAKREIIRRLGTSATQFYRLLDQTNYAKSVDQLLRLLNVLDCEVELLVRAKSA